MMNLKRKNPIHFSKKTKKILPNLHLLHVFYHHHHLFCRHLLPFVLSFISLCFTIKKIVLRKKQNFDCIVVYFCQFELVFLDFGICLDLKLDLFFPRIKKIIFKKWRIQEKNWKTCKEVCFI